MVRAEAAGKRTCSLRRGVGGSSFKLPVASCFVTESKNMQTQYTGVCTDVSFTKSVHYLADRDGVGFKGRGAAESNRG